MGDSSGLRNRTKRTATKALCLWLPLQVLGLFLSNNGNAADTPSPTVKVEVQVNASNGLDEQITSYVDRELRTIKDVEVTGKGSNALLLITAMPTSSNNRPTGYALAVTVARRLKGEVFADLLAKKVSESTFLSIIAADMGGSIWGQSVRTLPPDRLEAVCKEIVAEADGGCFEDIRKSKPWTADPIEAPPAK